MQAILFAPLIPIAVFPISATKTLSLLQAISTLGVGKMHFTYNNMPNLP
jgi:hypothetical protein